MTWQESASKTVLEPEREYEGVDLPLEPSVLGWARERVRQPRNLAIFREGGGMYLLYAVAGEYGISIAEVQE